jgi:hypothetical protein
LDRCEPAKAVDIIEAINLFLDSVGCVFVLGMDSVAVIASIESKYKELLTAVRRENNLIVSPGRKFLDKIIQVPFLVPRPTRKSINGLVEEIMQPKNANVLGDLSNMAATDSKTSGHMAEESLKKSPHKVAQGYPTAAEKLC